MIGFFIKKAFFDGWDAMLSIVLQNLIYITLLVLAGSVVFILPSGLWTIGVVAFFTLLTSILMGGSAATTYNYSNYEKTTWEPFWKGIRRNIRHSLAYFLCVSIMVLGILVGLFFYLPLGGVLGIVMSVVMFWIFMAFALALPFYFPLMNLLPGDGPFKTLKKSFIIVIDNLGFSFFFLFYNIILGVLSVLTLGLLPGLTGMMLGAEDAMNLRMLKYDWLEENPDENRRHIPWAELIWEEKEKIGSRSLKSMIFPWKY